MGEFTKLRVSGRAGKLVTQKVLGGGKTMGSARARKKETEENEERNEEQEHRVNEHPSNPEMQDT